MTVQATSASKKRVEREELTGLQRESWRLKEERETLTKPRPVVRPGSPRYRSASYPV